MSLIDSHCHLNSDFLPKTDSDLVREAEQEGIEALVTIGTDLATLPDVQRISEKFENVYHSVGVHPHEASILNEWDYRALEKAALHAKCRAIGEIGLDYHYDHSPRDIQQERLERQLDLALRLKQPVVIHSREGEADLLRALTHYSKNVASGVAPGIIHCFSGTLDFGKACVDLGFSLSFSGILTFKKADEIRETARALPLESMLVETDSPYLAPLPFRGKKCEPKMVKLTALKLAEVKGISFDQVAEITTANAKRIFRIS